MRYVSSSAIIAVSLFLAGSAFSGGSASAMEPAAPAKSSALSPAVLLAALQSPTAAPSQRPMSSRPRLAQRFGNDHHWVRLGCVSSSEHCEDRAHGRGYHHHRVVQDHHACYQEPHLLCLGRN